MTLYNIREDATAALFTLLQTVTNFTTAKRRFEDWEKVASAQRPSLRMLENQENVSHPALATPGTILIGVAACLYWDAPTGDDEVPATVMNRMLASVDLVMRPNPTNQRLDLGLFPMVQDCWIEGDVIKDPGDLDGVGLAIVPIKILLLP